MRFAYGLASACALGFLVSPWFVSEPPEAIGARAAPEPTEGRLMTRLGKDKEIVDVPLEHTDVHIRVDGYLADATVTQRFRNPYRDTIEAVYLFPLPANAAVHHMEMKVGDRVIEGRIARRNDAKRVYRKARKKGHTAALLTQERDNLFTQSLANIAPGARVEVTLRYVEPLEYDNGSYELVFPMVAGPRYLPKKAQAMLEEPDRSAIQPQVLPPGQRSSHDISLQVTIDAGVTIRDLVSPSHRLHITAPSSADAAGSLRAVTIADDDTIPNKDFVLRYRVAGERPELAVLAHRDGEGSDGSFILIAQPPAMSGEKALWIGHREIVFALDTSSSMAGAPLAKAKEVIRRVLGGLRPDDTYQIVRFADATSALGPRPIANKPKNIAYTLQWLDGLEAHGGTEMIQGIDAALTVPHDPARLRIVVFLTDGYVGNEDEILARVSAGVGESRLFSFGVGSAVNRYLLEEMAALGRGAVQVVRPDEDTDAAVDRLHGRIDQPILSDIRIDWNGLAVRHLTPAAVPDLFAGQPIVVAGRYSAPGAATIAVHGTMAGKPVRFEVPVVLPGGSDAEDGKPAVASVWARKRIKELSRGLVRQHEAVIARSMEDEIVALALENRLMTRYTAFVAVDRTRVAKDRNGEKSDGGRRVIVPVEVPDAVRSVSYNRGSGGYGTIGHGSMGFGMASSSFAASKSGSGGLGYGTIGSGSAEGSGVGYGANRGSFGAGRRSNPPQIRIGTVSVTGDLDKGIIRRYVRRKMPQVRYCYERALRKDATLAATVVTQFTIGPDGGVMSASAAGSQDEVLDRCIAGVVQAIGFPKVKGGGVVVIRYPFKLRPPEPPDVKTREVLEDSLEDLDARNQGAKP